MNYQNIPSPLLANRLGHPIVVDGATDLSSFDPDAPVLAAKAKRLYADRRKRTEAFGEHTDLFGEPAWDILLDLFIAGSEGRTVRVSDSCIAAAVPRTTALRWLGVLAQRGFIKRTSDEVDARSSIVALTGEGSELLDRYLAQIA